MAEFLAAVAGAVVGATIARALGADDTIVAAAIAGSFVGGGLVPAVRAARDRRTTPPREP